MAFPSIATVLDDFNRASLGSNWTNIFGTMSISSDQLAGQSGGTIAYYTASTFGPDVEVYADVPVITGEGGAVYLFARMKISPVDGYYLAVTFSLSGNDTIALLRITGGVSTTLASTNTRNVGAGDSIGLEIIGNTLKAYIEVGSGWEEVLSTSDSTYTLAGYSGAGIVSSTGRLDNFSGGTVVSGGVTVTPDPNVLALATPAVTVSITGSASVTPAVNTVALSTPALSAVLGSISVTPTVNTIALSTPALSAVLGSISITPTVNTIALSTPALSAVLGSISITPAVNVLTHETVDPSVVLGSITITPTTDVLSLGVIDPGILLGSLSITPATAVVSYLTVDPTVEITGGGTEVTPDTNNLAFSTPVLSVTLGSLNITPTANLLQFSTSPLEITLGSLTFNPSSIIINYSTNVSVELGALSLSLTPNVLFLETAGPVVDAGDGLNITPAANVLQLGTPDVSVTLGSVTVNNLGAELKLATQPSDVILGALSLSLAANVMTFVTVDPEVILGDITLQPIIISYSTPTLLVTYSSVIITPVVSVINWLSIDPTVIIGTAAVLHPTYYPAKAIRRVFQAGQQQRLFFAIRGSVMIKLQKSPFAVIDFGVDWSPWLAAGDTIVQSVWEDPSGSITITNPTSTENSTAARFSGGVEGDRQLIVNKITTADGEQEQFTFDVSIVRK